MSETLPKGWGWPGNSKKAHYFMEGSITAICGRWAYSGKRTDTWHDSPDNCAECKRRRAKLYPTPEGDAS